jgi:putative spermidine/putrescine transport system permease protein
MSIHSTEIEKTDIGNQARSRFKIPWRRRWKIIKKKINFLLMLAPAFFIIFGLFGGALINAVIEGFGYIPALKMTDFTFDHYIETFTSKQFVEGLLFGLRLSIIPIIVSVIISMFISVLLTQRVRGRGILKFIYRLPLQIPGLVAIFMILSFLTGGGFLARGLYALGIIQDTGQFPPLLHSVNGIGIMLVYIWNQIAFMTLVLYAFLIGLDPNYEEAARTLGANRWNVFRYVQLPLMMPAVLVVSLLNFAFAFGDFATPQILGPTTPSTLPVMAYRIFLSSNLADRPRAMAMMVVVAAISGIILFLYTVVVRKNLYTTTKVRGER